MKVHNLFTLIHYHLFQLDIINDSNDSKICITFPFTLRTHQDYKPGNDVSEFMHLNCITQSYYSSPQHKSLIHKYSIHFSHFCTQ